MKLEIERKWLISGGIAAVVIVAVVVIALTSGGSSKSAHHPLSKAEEAEVVREIEGDPTDPREARNLEEMIIEHPRNEEATAAQLRQQIITNAESSDPTHEQEAFCSYTSSYRHYVHYLCQGYTVGGRGGYASVEVTVDESTGEVSVEPLLE
ncbi:MAG: hypothetical protein ACTHN3_05125 [Solirubrobacterales bacterium]